MNDKQTNRSRVPSVHCGTITSQTPVKRVPLKFKLHGVDCMRLEEWATCTRVIPGEFQDFLPLLSSLLPAFTSWLRGQPEPHQAGHFFWTALSLAMVKVVQGLVAPGGRQQAQVCVWGVMCLLLGTAVPFSCYLWWEKKENITYM